MEESEFLKPGAADQFKLLKRFKKIRKNTHYIKTFEKLLLLLLLRIILMMYDVMEIS